MASHDRDTEQLQVLMLVGLVGSGKTGFANALEGTGKWVRASQDDAPNRRRQEAEAMTRKALRGGRNAVIDRVNFDRKQRSHFIEIAREFPNVQCTCVVLDVKRETLEARLAVRTGHPTLVDVDVAMRVLRQMQRKYKPPRPDAPEGYSRVYIMPEDEQPEGGVWTEAKLEELLSKVEASPWRDEPYVPPPPKQPSVAARRGYSGADEGSNGNNHRSYSERSRGGFHGNEAGYGRPHHRYHNPPFRPWDSTMQQQGDGYRFQGGGSPHHLWGEQRPWQPQGRPTRPESYGPAVGAVHGTGNPPPVYPGPRPEHGSGWRPSYRPRDAAFGHDQVTRRPYRDGRELAGSQIPGSREAQYSEYGRPPSIQQNHNNVQALPSIKTAGAELEAPLSTPSTGDAYGAT